ncbi:hypothetical protein [Azotobacter beijerinckii]|uniref:hypothetical protein n=1 Tax=Azotobacter beijerinckii TaxID=170623 RepID=UPI002954FF5A|nr:hypothetical protein [Azotobacter beijerinckii]MDV7213584.1 hypothetical protein [Azotobacter beijerinckii]
MRNIEEQRCHLCQQKARFYFVDHGDKKYFDCPSCKRYLISNLAENFLIEAIEEVRKETAKFASESKEDEATVISCKVTSEGKQITVAYEPRKTLPI